MSKADKWYKENNNIKTHKENFGNKIITSNLIEYKEEDGILGHIHTYDLINEEVNIESQYNRKVDMEELKIIVSKCKELGWLDE